MAFMSFILLLGPIASLGKLYLWQGQGTKELVEKHKASEVWNWPIVISTHLPMANINSGVQMKGKEWGHILHDEQKCECRGR